MINRLSSHLGPISMFSGNINPTLILYLDAGNTNSYIGYGTQWNDLSHYHNNGVFESEPIFSNIYNTIQFNSNVVTFSGLTAIPLGNTNYTIEVWAQSTLNNNGGIIGWGDYGQNNKVNAFRYNSNGLINYWWANDAIDYPLNMLNSIFYHLVAIYNGTHREIWINGTMSLQNTPSDIHIVDNMNNLTIGVTNFNEYLDGSIGLIKVYNKSLSTNEIINNFNNQKLRFGYQYGSYVLNGSNYISGSSSNYIVSTNNFTLEAFVNIFTYSNDYGGIVSFQDIGYNGFGINIGNNSKFQFTINSTTIDAVTFSINTWYHLSMSRFGNTTSYFVNGALQGQLPDTTNYNNTNFVIGRYYIDLDDHYTNSIISNIRFSNTTAIYTSNFTIPSVELMDNSSVLLLLSQKNLITLDFSTYNNTLINNNNVGWTSSLPNNLYQSGLYRTIYAGYFNDNVLFFNSAPTTELISNIGTFDSGVQNSSINWNPGYVNSGVDTFSMQWIGYFTAPTTDTYTFYTYSDDASYLWIGNNTIDNYTTMNALVSNGGIHGLAESYGTINLIGGKQYPIRIQFGENAGGDCMIVSWSTMNVTKTQDFTGLITYNNLTNGF